MLEILRVFYVLIILNILKENTALVELPHVEDNDILNTELIIRSITNKLFSSIKLKGVKQNQKLKQYGLIHNYFISLTLKDYKNLKEIARLTRADKKPIGNSSINFIDLVNEILNADIGIESNTITSGETFKNGAGYYIDEYSQNIAYLKETYGDNSPRVDINKNIIEILENDPGFLHKTPLSNEKNNSNTDSNNLLGENEFWIPDLGYRRIFKGQRTRVKRFPFMASVQFFNNFQCGGSIIKDDLVITAASCLQLVWNNRMFRENPSFLSVRIGSNYYEGGGERIAVLEVYFYPTYDPKTLRNNLAIMRLVRRIRFKRRKDSRVKKINIDRHDHPLPMTTSGVTIVGWGAKSKTIVHKPWDNKISFAVLDLYPLQDCQDTYSKTYVTHLNFCAGKISTGSGACNKDIGGPGIVYGNLTGIISFGSPTCGTPDAPTVFTKVGYYSDWIEEIMEQEKIIPTLKKITTTTTKFPIFLPNPTTEEFTTKEFTTPTTTPTTIQTTVTDKGRLLFIEFLKTMFDSKEIDEYIESDNDENSQKNNAGIIGIRQKQLEEIGVSLTNKPEHFTHLVPVKNVDASEDVAILTTESYQSLERITRLDELLMYDSKKNYNNDKPENDDVIGTSEENIDLNHIVSEEAGTKKESAEDIVKLLDDFERQEKIMQSSPWKKDDDEVDLAVYNLFKSDEFEGRKEADTYLAKLIDNMDIQEEIKSLWSVKKDKKVPKKLSENNKVSKKLSEDKKVPEKLIINTNVPKKLSKDKNVPEKLIINKNVPKKLSKDKNVPQKVSEDKKVPKKLSENKNVPKKLSGDKKVPKKLSGEKAPKKLSIDKNVPKKLSKDKNIPKKLSEHKKVPKKRSEEKKAPKKLSIDKNVPKKLSKDKKVPKKLSKDNSIFTFMYVSDSEKDINGVKINYSYNMTEIMTDTNESDSDKIDLFSDAEKDTKLEGDSSNSLELEDLNVSDEIQSSNVAGLPIEDKTFIQDLTYRKNKDENLFGDELSKKVLLDILSDVIDYQNANKTINT